MGKHWVPGNSKPVQRTFPSMARAVAAAGVLAATVYAVNLSTDSAGPVRLAGSVDRTGTPAAVAPAGAFGTGNAPETQADSMPQASDQVGAGSLPPAIASDPHVTLAFPHAAIDGFLDPSAGLTVDVAGAGRPPAGFLMAPLQTLDPSSPFGFRVSPLSGTAGDFHLGQDYAAACGTPVYAADSGVVRAAGWHPWGGGNRVEIDHGDGLITTYNHLESIGVHAGDRVQVGQAIARVGTTGWSTGCHLHFETIENGRYTNPLNWSFLPLRALGLALPASMVSYGPGPGLSDGRISWTIPLQVDRGGAPASGLEASPLPSAQVSGPAPAGTALPTSAGQSTTPAAPAAAGPSASAPAPSTDPATSGPTAAPSPSPSPSEPATTSPASTDPTTTTPTDPTTTPTPTPTDPTTTTTTPTDPTTVDPAPAPTTVEPAPAPTTVEPAPAPSPTTDPTQPQPLPTTDPVPTSTQTQEFPTQDPYAGPTATNSPYDQSSADATPSTPVPDPTAP